MTNLDVTFRPIDTWPGERTTYPKASPFSARWSDTLDLLRRELDKLDARNIVVQIALDETQIRLDGWPRSGATPKHPGVILAFESRHGPLKYATDVFRSYEDNLRAIALGLESLRRVDRYGITKRGEQYTGWRALTAGGDDQAKLERGRQLIGEHGGARAALMATHPDRGGDREDYEAVQAARDA